MKDSIKLSSASNRKVILEVRYKPDPSFIDARGNLIKKVIEADIIRDPHWELGMGDIKVLDNNSVKESKLMLFAEINRFSFISLNNETNESFINKFERFYNILKSCINKPDIIRIGCRIQGTYYCKSNNYEEVTANFANIFPSKFLVEAFPIKDLQFKLVYQNGQYMIGPIIQDDPFLKNEFPTEAKYSPGFAIDTDNYILKSKEKPIIDESGIKDVYLTSLSVEKLLFDKLSEL